MAERSHNCSGVARKRSSPKRPRRPGVSFPFSERLSIRRALGPQIGKKLDNLMWGGGGGGSSEETPVGLLAAPTHVNWVLLERCPPRRTNVLESAQVALITGPRAASPGASASAKSLWSPSSAIGLRLTQL